MSMSPPNDELRALIATEKKALADPDRDARARLLERLGPLLATPVVVLAAPSLSVPKRKLVAGALGTFLVGAATGAALHAASAPRSVDVRYVDRVVQVDRAVEGAAPERAETVSPSSLPNVPTSRVERRQEPPPNALADSDDALANERQLVEKARSALARGDADGALTATVEHSRTFPRGQLVELREAIAVQALVRAKRDGEARDRAAHFRRTFPGSVYSQVVEAAISSLP